MKPKIRTQVLAIERKTPALSRLLTGLALLMVMAAILLTSACAAAPQAAPAGAAVAEPLPKEVSVSEAAKLRDEGAFVLDVRTQEEWNAFHIPETTLITLDQLQSRLSEVPRDKEVVVVCRSGNRSASGRDILLQAGYPSVTSMAGGVTQWQAQGLPTVTGP